MSVVAALLLLAAGPPAGVDPALAAQVTAIAGKLHEWRGAWGVAGKTLGCKTARTTGDEDIDAIGCAALLACVKPAYPQLKAIADGKGTVDEKKRKIGAKLATLDTCMKQHRGEGIAALALARTGKLKAQP